LLTLRAVVVDVAVGFRLFTLMLPLKFLLLRLLRLRPLFKLFDGKVAAVNGDAVVVLPNASPHGEFNKAELPPEEDLFLLLVVVEDKEDVHAEDENPPPNCYESGGNNGNENNTNAIKAK
jgi:hypothetical protein